MSFTDSIRSSLRQYVGFTGRARRSEFWWFTLFGLLVSIATTIVDTVVLGRDADQNGPVGVLAGLALLLPSLAVGVRRLHDSGRSGWWLLISFVPLVGAVVLLVFWVSDSTPANEHGPNPKEHGADPVGPAGPYPAAHDPRTRWQPPGPQNFGQPGQPGAGPGPYGA